MTKNISNGQERFDGFAVELYEGAFSGAFDMDEDFAREIGYDDQVTFIVTGRVSSVNFGETKVGDIKRKNVFQISSAAALDPSVAQKLLLTAPDPKQLKGQGNLLTQTQTHSSDVVVGSVKSGSDPVLDSFLNGDG